MAPKQKPSLSKQDYGTPKPFLKAVKYLLGIDDFACDLAASAENTVCSLYFNEANNSLADDVPWSFNSNWCWLNPPFGHLEPWVRKAWLEHINANARTAVLVPASPGSNWWKNWVHNKAVVLFLNGRLSFDGKGPYPKDLALLLCGLGSYYKDYLIWDWRTGAGCPEHLL